MATVHPFHPPSSAPDAIQRNNNNPSETYPCGCWCFLFLITFAIANGIGLAVSNAQKYHDDCKYISIPKLEIASISVSNFNPSSRPNQISADWNVEMNLKTMDGHGYLNFSGISVSIYYDVLQVGLSNLMPFDITPRNSTRHFDEKFSGSSRLIDDSIISAMDKDITAGTVTVDVQIKASVTKSFRRRWVDHKRLVFDCKNVDLFFGYSDKSQARMLNPSHKCQVQQRRCYY